jgi:hypothetical protein
MIQRTQSIYLFFVAVLTGISTLFDLAHYIKADEIIYKYSVYKIVPSDGSVIIIPGNWMAQIALISAIVLLSLITISRFNNRKLQIKLGAINYLLLVTLIISSYFSVENTPLILENGEDLETLYYIGFYTPIAAVTFLFLANRGIKKDEELVKSVDRLR